MARNAEQNKRMRDERREQILSHAVRLFAAKGLAATRISDIAEAAEISKGLLYHYYRSKDEVFVEIVRRAFVKMNTAAKALEKEDLPPRRKIEKALSEMTRGLSRNDDFARTILLIAEVGSSEAVPEEAKSIVQKESSVPYIVIEHILKAGQKDGSIRKCNARDLSLLFWVIIKGLALHKITLGAHFKAPDLNALKGAFFVEK